VRVIQGDGIDFMMLGKILTAIRDAGWSADNLAFGSGGGLLQKLNRDTQKFAFKCSSIVVGPHERDVFKRPITDGGKKSKAGRLKLVRDVDGRLKTVRESDAPELPSLLQTVFENGRVIQADQFDVIRERAAAGL